MEDESTDHFSPGNQTISILEFTPTTQTVSIVDQPTQQWRITSIDGYTTSNGMVFDDLTWSTTEKSFTFTSEFMYAVLRKVYYTTLSDDQSELYYGAADNIPLLPPVYDVLYRSDYPQQSMMVSFNIVGQTRTGDESSSDDSGSSTVVWGSWVEWSQQYTITITTNMDKHSQLLRQACMQSRLAANSPTKPSWD